MLKKVQAERRRKKKEKFLGGGGDGGRYGLGREGREASGQMSVHPKSGEAEKGKERRRRRGKIFCPGAHVDLERKGRD